MTHIVREVDRQGSKLKGKEVVEPVSVIETPPMVGVGLIGYKDTAQGLKNVGVYWAGHIADTMKRRFYKNWYRSSQKAFSRLGERTEDAKTSTLDKIKNESQVIRVIAHTDQDKLNKPSLRLKKAHVIEVQVNGGLTIEDKFNFAKQFLEQPISVDSVFQPNEQIDVVGITTGHGFEGVIHRWGIRRLPRKTHRGLRKVACIGAWHPSRVRFQVARPGQNGFHHRTELNKKIYHIGEAYAKNKANAATEYDHTQKTINPMGGFPWYGEVKQQYLVVKGSVPGPVRRTVTLRKAMAKQTSRAATEVIKLKIIDTSSKQGHGTFQTSEEKAKFMGKLKKDKLKEKSKAK